MSREKYRPLRRQLLRPLSLAGQASEPAALSETVAPLPQPVLPQPVLEGQVDFPASSTGPGSAIEELELLARQADPPASGSAIKELELLARQLPSQSHITETETQMQTHLSNTTPPPDTTSIEPASSSWMQPQPRKQTPGLFAAPSDPALPQQNEQKNSGLFAAQPGSASPQPEPQTARLLATPPGAALPQRNSQKTSGLFAAPPATVSPQPGQKTSGLFAAPSSATSSQPGSKTSGLFAAPSGATSSQPGPKNSGLFAAPSSQNNRHSQDIPHSFAPQATARVAPTIDGSQPSPAGSPTQPDIPTPQQDGLPSAIRARLQTEQPFTRPVEPASSSWVMPQSRPRTSGLLGWSPGAAITEKEPAFSSWALPQKGRPFTTTPLPQTEQHLAAASLQTQQQRAVARPAPISSSWIPPQPGQSGTLVQEAPIAQVKTRTNRKSAVLPPVFQPKGQKATGRKRVPLWFAVCSVIVVLMVVLTQGNGTVGAWAADTFRSIVGPVATAQVEAWYLNAQNKIQQLQFQMSGQHVASPWQLTPTTTKPTPTPTPPAWATMKPMQLSSMQPIVSPALSGEGTWNVLEQAHSPYNYLPLSARAFIRPDPAFPYAVVTLLQFDARFSRLHVVSGTQEPGGPLGAHGKGVIPPADQEGNALLATLNGGFKYADGAYGLMTNGKVYVPAQPKAATIAVTREGKLLLGAWGVDPQLRDGNKDLLAWRQNASLLIDKGVINPLTKDGAAWGGTILNSEYTWRSGLGITAQGNLVYAAGNALVPETLGKALLAAGAVNAMETDINPFWVRAFLYQRGNDGKLTITKLNQQMQGTGYEYLNVDQRDFFYLTRYTPPTNGATPTPAKKTNRKESNV